MTEQASKYADQTRDQLLKEADDRKLKVTGTGAQGYVTVDDLTAALEADDARQAEHSPGDESPEDVDSLRAQVAKREAQLDEVTEERDRSVAEIEDLAKRLASANEELEHTGKLLSRRHIPGAAEVEGRDAERREIVRQTDTTWWCPFDDHSMSTAVGRCPSCHAVRDGDHAERA